VHVTHVVGVSNSEELSTLMVKEFDVTILGVSQVLDGMSSLERGITTSLVLKVVEVSKVLKLNNVEFHKLNWASIWVEGSWSSNKVSTVLGVIKLMISCDMHVTHVVSVSNSDKLSSLMVKEFDIAVLGVGEVLDGVSSLEGSISSGLILKVVEVSEILEVNNVKFHKLGWGSIWVEGSWHNLSVSVVGEVLEFVET